MPKRLPKFKRDRDLEKTLQGDLSEYLTAPHLHAPTFEFAPKSKVVNLRMSEDLLAAVKQISKKRGMPYQRYIREAIEQSIRRGG